MRIAFEFVYEHCLRRSSVFDLTSEKKVAAAADNILGYKSKWLEIAANSIYQVTEESGEVCYYANEVICNLTGDFYGVKFNAIAIIENGDAYTYAKPVSTSRSIYEVVNSAVLDKYADRIIGDLVAADTKLDYANWYGQGEYPVSPKTVAQYVKYNELKETTLKDLDIVRQDVLVDDATVTIGDTAVAVEFLSEDGEVVSPSGKVELSFRTDDYFDRTKAEVYYMDDNGRLTKLSASGYGRYVVAETDKTGTYIVCISGVSFNMPMWGYALILVGAVIIIAGVVVAIIVVAKRKKRNLPKFD